MWMEKRDGPAGVRGGTGTRICPAEGVKLSVSKHPYVSALLGLAKRTHQALIHGKTVL